MPVVPVFDVEGQGQENQDGEPKAEPAISGASHDNEFVKVPTVLRHIAKANEAKGEMRLH
jgi:hypothetical protein